MPDNAADRHFALLQALQELLGKRFMDMPAQPTQNPYFERQVPQIPQIRGDLPIQSDTQLEPGQQWNRLEQNLLGPVPPPGQSAPVVAPNEREALYNLRKGFRPQ